MAVAERISQKLDLFQPSLTLKLKTIANRRRNRGLPIYDFGLGETKGELAVRIRDAAISAYDEGRTMYDDPAGVPELRRKVLEWLDVDEHYGIENVVVTTGAKQSLLNVFLAACDAGDTILMEAAPWVSYEPLALAANAVGAGIAGRHVYIQNLPEDQVPPDCGAGLDYLMDVFGPFETVRMVLTSAGECAEINWQFLGLTMPGWALVWFVLLGGLAVVANWQRISD